MHRLVTRVLLAAAAVLLELEGWERPLIVMWCRSW